MEDRDKYGPGHLIIFYMGKLISRKELYRGKRVTDLPQLMGPKDTTTSPFTTGAQDTLGGEGGSEPTTQGGSLH